MRYNSYNTFLIERFGERVQKIALEAALSCPNRANHRMYGSRH